MNLTSCLHVLNEHSSMCLDGSWGKRTDLMILDLASHYTEGVVACVVVDVDSAEAGGTTSRDPLLIGIVVHHDSGSRLADTLFTVQTKDRETENIMRYIYIFLNDLMIKHSFPKEHRVL